MEDLPSDIAALRDRAVAFHGHLCPGLAIGIQAARIGLATCGHDGDKDVVAVVETDMADCPGINPEASHAEFARQGKAYLVRHVVLPWGYCRQRTHSW